MALKEHLLLTILITTLIGVSTALAWNPNIHRYESYDLEKGPVFYEAYYPDSSEESAKSYQEKRYFDRGTVLERTYQVPTYPNNNLRVDNSQNPTGRFQYPDGYIDPRLSLTEKNVQSDHLRSFPADRDYTPRNNVLRFPTGDAILEEAQNDRLSERPSSLDIKEISSLARRAISRDLENWQALEGYLDRTNYQDPRTSHRRIADIDFARGNAVDVQLGEAGPTTLLDSFREERGTRGVEPYEKVREESTGLRQDRIEPSDERRNTDVMRGLDARDLASRATYPAFDPARYENERLYQRQTAKSPFELPVDETTLGQQSFRAPSENIFEPRPQVINYIFSRRPSESAENKTENALVATKAAAEERAPRNYGDNLIREEMKKTEEGKDVKVTSIEISEVPRHKTRHHHGEWPKRDYSHRRHQS